MKQTIIQDTFVSGVKPLNGPGGRIYQEIRVGYKGAAFRPGQFVMIRRNQGPTDWAYPYMIQDADPEGYTVYATAGTSLFNAKPGLPVVIWGANGTGVEADRDTLVVSEEATFFFASPFLKGAPECRHGVLCGTEAGIFGEMGNLVLADSEEALAGYVLGGNYKKVVAALNIATLQKLVASMEEFDTSRLWVFASSQISCGVGACKSCYLHDRDLPLGISVCCNGPFLKYQKLDFEADRRCFRVFQ